MLKNFTGLDQFIFFIGVIETREDPLFLGRVKVRCIGWDRSETGIIIPTEDLPWAHCLSPVDHGNNSIGAKPGDWVAGFFIDSTLRQQPVVMGVLHGIPEEAANLDRGFCDMTPDDALAVQPRPPEFRPIEELNDDGNSEDREVALGQFNNPLVLPGEGTVFGELESEYDPANFKFDVNDDGVYNSVDAQLIGFDKNQDGVISRHEDKFLSSLASGDIIQETLPITRYPLNSLLREPTTSRLARGELGDGKIEETIVAKKKGELVTAEAASHESTGVGSDIPVEAEAFGEPATPYDAKYPFNHVYESESGHVEEIDDTPGFERLHRYHRSGTFEEIHPNGLKVNKTVDKLYEIAVEDYYLHTGASANMTSKTAFRIMSGSEMNLKAGASMNQDVGGDHNIIVKGSSNHKIDADGNLVIAGDLKVLVQGNIFYSCNGDIKMKANGDFLINARNIVTSAQQQNVLSAGLAVVTQGPLTYLDSALSAGTFIRAQVADVASSATTVTGLPVVVPPVVVPVLVETENDADEVAEDVIASESSSLKEGFLLDGTSGDVYKPISDGDGTLVVLSTNLGAQARLFEAVPTGDLEEVTIQYKQLDNSITSWDVVRPVHKKGDLIEAGRFSGNANSGRDHWRFTRTGGGYPKQMILEIGQNDYLILISAVRHEVL